MNILKRAFDISFSVVLIAILSPILILTALVVLILDGKPVFFISERMKTEKIPFQLIKFRTMTTVETDAGVSGGDKTSRVTKSGRFLRKKRLDEIPQLFNILTGDMSFVGPRPPLRQYVEQFPNIYAKVLQSRPGVTGLATVKFHKHEARLLSKCTTQEDTDRVYCTQCIPKKARLDLIYQKNSSLCFDMAIMATTLAKV